MLGNDGNLLWWFDRGAQAGEELVRLVGHWRAEHGAEAGGGRSSRLTVHSGCLLLAAGPFLLRLRLQLRCCRRRLCRACQHDMEKRRPCLVSWVRGREMRGTDNMPSDGSSVKSCGAESLGSGDTIVDLSGERFSSGRGRRLQDTCRGMLRTASHSDSCMDAPTSDSPRPLGQGFIIVRQAQPRHEIPPVPHILLDDAGGVGGSFATYNGS